MAKYSHDRVVPFRDSGLSKKQQVAEMFDKIAFRYDFINRFLSVGIDLRWRRKAIREVAAAIEARTIGARGVEARALKAHGSETHTGEPHRSEAPLVLDVATGTADMAIMMTRRIPRVQIKGIDISAGMLEIGRQKIVRQHLGERIELLQGDSEAIPFPDDHFDAITVAFGVRNFENLEKGLQEMRRVLKPGGKLVILEFSQPRSSGARRIYNIFFRLGVGVGRVVSGSGEAYQYLNDSVKAFPEGEHFLHILNNTGYTGGRQQRLSLGVCSIYTGEK